LYEHRVGDHALMPGAGLAELVRAAAEHAYEGEAAEVVSLVLQAPLVLPEHGGQRVQVVIKDEGEATVYSQPAEASSGARWTLHASAEVRRFKETSLVALDLSAIRRQCPNVVDVAHVYETARDAGLDYGEAFRGLRSLHSGEGEALGEVQLPEGVEAVESYGIHPALLDAAFQVGLGLSTGGGLI
jgi:acyl transferase domain-containing protein